MAKNCPPGSNNCLQVRGGGWVLVGLWDYCVTQVPIGLGLGFGTALGLGLRGPDLGLGLDNTRQKNYLKFKITPFIYFWLRQELKESQCLFVRSSVRLKFV